MPLDPNPENLRFIEADVRIELFYGDVMASCIKNKISDGEIVAILSMICGRMIGAAQTGLDRTTLQDTIVYNIQHGRETIKGLLEAVGKGH